MTLLCVLCVLFFIPWSWTKCLWNWAFKGCWKRSSMKVIVDAGGKKLASFKDQHLTKANKPKEEVKI